MTKQVASFQSEIDGSLNAANRRLSPMIEAMMAPAFYPHPAADVDLRQTHTSNVFLAGGYAYKVKKPVAFAFVDCSTPAKRRELCEREVLLNRRLSPGIYLGVVPIIFKTDTYALGEEKSKDGSDVVDFAVKMRRLPDDRRLDGMIAAGSATSEDISRIAQRIAEFHAGASNREAWTNGSAAAVWQMIEGNLRETEGIVADTLSRGKLAAVETYSHRYVSAHWEFLNQRARDRRVLEGHGDLRTDCIYLMPDGIEITDCLEFSDALRYCDAASEIAFLAMDLDRLGKPDFSRELVRRYLSAANDPDIAMLMPFYKCYRATVRAKVDLLRSHQDDCPVEQRLAARERARGYLELACGYAEEGCHRGLVVVCGPSGTGKSTLARKLQQLLEFEIFGSDLQRKRLVGISPTARVTEAYGKGIYSAEVTERTYRSLVAEAAESIKGRKGVILDATFRHKSERALVIDLAKRFGLRPVFVECRADKTEVIRRLLQRRTRAAEISDATVEIYQAQLNDFEPLQEIPQAYHVVADAGSALDDILLEVERRVRLYSDSADTPS